MFLKWEFTEKGIITCSARDKMKRIYWYIFWSVTLLHLMATAICGLKAFSMGMSRFDSGNPISRAEESLLTIWGILASPIATAWMKLKLFHLPGILGWFPFILNSLLWSGLVIVIILTVQKLKNPQTKSLHRIQKSSK